MDKHYVFIIRKEVSYNDFGLQGFDDEILFRYSSYLALNIENYLLERKVDSYYHIFPRYGALSVVSTRQNVLTYFEINALIFQRQRGFLSI